ncbi:MEKHLA domain-containing protein [Planktothrix sp. FACHB-1365]|uniref:MEKHLA domain-containing protein n=1 Tax=Planktothrix sp. FACHB-1365 TaxID=2692855 RepID=UPI0016830200|nr:MEKHLA domain-containing protein [Planktothrix sp. FACHB-1365]MBD2485686.1 MEKHLA domain-containing protein [Planktothrix sp. FACHB-1365]
MILPWKQDTIILHTQRLLRSYQYWTGETLLDLQGTPEAIAEALFYAPFVLVSHGIEPDPIFNYGNQKALELWELTWEKLTQMPSRKTAEPMEQEARNHLLAETKAKGFLRDYKGVRISNSGRRFFIQDVLIWNVLDEQNQRCGQAAVFSKYTFL